MAVGVAQADTQTELEWVRRRLQEVKKRGFGRVVIEVQNGTVVTIDENWKQNQREFLEEVKQQ